MKYISSLVLIAAASTSIAAEESKHARYPYVTEAFFNSGSGKWIGLKLHDGTLLTRKNSLCTLAKVQGEFSVGNEVVQVEHDSGKPGIMKDQWTIYASEGVNAEAYCLVFRK